MNNDLISGIFYMTTSCEYESHHHFHYEIIFVQDGECEITINDGKYIAKKNDIILISNLENHTSKILKAPYKRYILNIIPAAFDSSIADIRLISMLKNRNSNFSHCLNMQNTNMNLIFQNILNESKANNIFKQDMLTMYIKQLLIETIREYPQNFKSLTDKRTQNIFKIQNYLDKNFTNDIKIDELGDMFFLNKYYLTHSFKEITGYSPKQYLTLIRLNNTLSLLQNTTLSIIEICFNSGFNDINNFIRLFKSKFNVTPKEYRNKFIHND